MMRSIFSFLSERHLTAWHVMAIGMSIEIGRSFSSGLAGLALALLITLAVSIIIEYVLGALK